MTIDTDKLRVSTKSFVSLLVGFGALMQVPAVNTFVFTASKDHPHIAPIVGALVGVAALLHNPQVDAILGIKQTVQVTTEQVTVPDAH